MSALRKISLVLFVVLVCVAKVQGQAGRSPFSTYGIGEPYGNGLIHNQGMGGIGVSQPQVWFLNNQNPALLVYNPITVFQAGIIGESKTIKSDTLSEKVVGGNLNYLVTAFPIKPGKWTSSLGLMPYTSVDYAVESFEEATDGAGIVKDTLITREQGSGGLTQFYFSNGVRLTRELAVGLKAAYIFGPIESKYSNRTTNPEQTLVVFNTIEEKTTAKDFLFTAGVSFSKDSLWRKNAYRLSIGATYTFASKLNASFRRETYQSLGGATVTEDTLSIENGSIEVPGALTFGLSLSRGGKWTVGTEFNYQDWSTLRSVNQDDEGLKEAWRAALGGEFTPDAMAGENYLKRVTYRVGVAYEKYPFIVNGNPVKDFGINFGFSLPAGRSSLDLAFKVGKRGNRSENLLEESYFKVYFGITFNDQWFIRRKFD
jgi:hypothetical protein